MPFPDLKIAAGKAVTIDMNHGAVQGKIRLLRPKTAAALKTIAGAPLDRPARLDDPEAFEVLPAAPGADFVQFEAGGKKTIGELNAPLFRALVTSLAPKAPIPGVVRIEQRVRTRAEALRKSLLPLSREPDALRRLGRLIKIQQLLIPKWLRDLRVYFQTLTFGDVEIGAGSTLTISAGVIALVANNWYMHEGAKVIQHSPHLTATVTGELKKL